MNYKPPFHHDADSNTVRDMYDVPVNPAHMPALLNRSIVDALPEGWKLHAVKTWPEVGYRARVAWQCQRPVRYGYGPTPEAAIQNAKENIHE
jgi:hypothetical protein